MKTRQEPVNHHREIDSGITEVASMENPAKPVPLSGSEHLRQNPAANDTRSSAPSSSPTLAANTGDEALAAYSAELLKWLNKHKRYPKRAKRKNQQGSVKIAFRVTRNGRITDFTIVESSGVRSLDEAVRKMIKKASPVPALPVEFDSGQMTFTLPIAFSLT